MRVEAFNAFGLFTELDPISSPLHIIFIRYLILFLKVVQWKIYNFFHVVSEHKVEVISWNVHIFDSVR
jgi:hypothetical protein